MALFSCPATKLSTEPASINLSDILQIKRQLASFRAKGDVAWSLVKNIVCPESDAAKDDISSYYINTSEKFISSHVKITCYLHT